MTALAAAALASTKLNLRRLDSVPPPRTSLTPYEPSTQSTEQYERAEAGVEMLRTRSPSIDRVKNGLSSRRHRVRGR